MPQRDNRRILFVTSNYPRWEGDSTTPFVLHLAQDLSDLGWDIDVLAPHAPGAKRRETLRGIPVYRFPYLWPFSQQSVCYEGGALANLQHRRGNRLKLPFLVAGELLAIAYRLSRKRYALVHSHWLLPQGFTAGLASGLFRCRHVTTVHGSDALALQSPFLRPFKRAALCLSDLVTVNGSATEREIRRLGVPWIPLQRIAMGVSASPPNPGDDAFTRTLGFQHRRGDGPLLLFVGRLAEEKGWRDLLQAMAVLSRRGSDATLLLLGEGRDRDQVKRQIADLGLADRVHLTGWVDHARIPLYMGVADIFVAPSYTTPDGRCEAQGLALAEAMLAGLPVIASRVGGIVDHVQHGHTGWLVEERAPRAIADAVQHLHRERALAEQMGERARLYVSRELSREHTALAFDRVYRHLLKDKDSKRSPPKVVAAAGEAPRLRILLIRHRREARFQYGGVVYTDSIRQLLCDAPLSASVHDYGFETPPAPWRHCLMNAFALLRSLVSRFPARVLRFRSRTFARRLRRLTDSGDFDLVLVSGLEMMWTRSLVGGNTPVVYLCHNLESELQRQQTGRLLRLPLLKNVLQSDNSKLSAFEQAEVAGSSGFIAISAQDHAKLSGLCGGRAGITVPPTFAEPRWEPRPRNDSEPTDVIRLGFVGNFAWWPNRRALDWFLREIWPHAPANLLLHVFGSGSQRLGNLERVTAHGYVESMDEVWESTDILIHPVRVAAGLNVKVAEAAYHRRPMIATPEALRGCALEPDPAIVTARDARQWLNVLAGPGLTELARRKVSLRNADRFARSSHRADVTRFVHALPQRRQTQSTS
jgi:phosphatidylinositol alpha-1,6-mannosyltransferase